MKRILSIIAVLAICISAAARGGEQKAKYVFLFIGDGMGFSHISATEAYLAHSAGIKCGSTPLTFTQFPVMGMATTFSANKPITCSSAAGTALATGTKTKNHMLGMDPDTVALKSIAYKIHDAGYKVGIMTTVGINHATPASFYAHNASRSAYYEIGLELPESGFEFFGGGGYLQPRGKDNDKPYLGDAAVKAGYKFARGNVEFEQKKCDRIIYTRGGEDPEGPLPYRFLRKDNDIILADVVKGAIEVLGNKSKGFFMMAEGGMIDFAAHANDGANTFHELMDFDEAIAVAYEFYKQHPDETLIVVTADHETGGITLGYNSGSVIDFSVFDELNENAGSNDTETYLNSKVVKKEYNEKAHLGWTTSGHTGGAVPVFAIGAGSQQFAGRQDNTDIPKKICKAMGIKF